MFMQAGLTPKIHEGAFGTLLAMVHSGHADIALELEPNVSQAELDGAHISLASQRSRHRRSIARTVLSAIPNRRATCRADALSQACPTASSNRLLKGALLGNWGTFSARNPQRGHFIRYVSTTTVVEYSKHGRSRTSRSLISWILLAGTC
jgi:hypothetical protein